MVRVLVYGTGNLPANCKIRAIYLNTSKVETRKKGFVNRNNYIQLNIL